MASITASYGALLEKALKEYDRSGAAGKVIVQVGSATCEITAGADRVRTEFQKLITASGRDDILLKQVGCTGRCAREPVVGVFVPGQMPVKYEQVSEDKVHTIFQKHILQGEPVVELILDKKTERLYDHLITICSSNQCCADKGEALGARLHKAIAAQGVNPESVRVMHSGCMGLCDGASDSKQRVMMVFPEKVIYRFKTDVELAEIVTSQLKKNTILDKYVTHTDRVLEEFFKLYGDVSFFNRQTRLTLRNSGLIDPESLTDYMLKDGYKALPWILKEKTPDWVIDEVTRSGLRGRGGGGFPTGVKWKNTTLNDDPIRYVVCNADEGDPGAFMDRSALEGDPFTIIEGMTLGGYAVGATKGFIYVRAEYPLAIERLDNAIKVTRDNNLLGKNILNSGFDFDIEIRLGAGAFVCGEETALLHSIEGKRGQPRMRPPYPSQSGLWGHPTMINNVETWANIAAILLFGADWYARFGTEKSKGTKVFALAGKVKNTGLVEVPMGTSLREIIFDIGGGLEEGRTLKAVQTGGPSGGCIPASKVDTPVDYEHLKALGSIMGSGGMIVLDDQDCMVSMSQFFVEFTQSESCGKCVPCREGTLRMLEILDKITTGKAELVDLDRLERLALLIKHTSLCGLGQSAPNPVLSALKNFREEFEAHIIEKRCPSHKCRQLLQFSIDSEKCVGCTLCARRCPVSCISGERRGAHVIDADECIKCGECFNACKFGAVIQK